MCPPSGPSSGRRLNRPPLYRAPASVPNSYYPDVSLIAASIIGDGMTVEVMATGQDGKRYPEGEGELVASFRAEADEAVRMVLFTERGDRVEVPVEAMERAIALAKKDVHSESYYDQRDGAV